jgi:hypothetical protein
MAQKIFEIFIDIPKESATLLNMETESQKNANLDAGNPKIGAIRSSGRFYLQDNRFQLVTNSQDIDETLKGIALPEIVERENISALLVDIIDADKLEIWATTSTRPYDAVNNFYCVSI